MMLSILLGVTSSLVAELVVWINKKLTDTVLRGRGAFLLALTASVVGAAVKEFSMPGVVFSWSSLATTTSQIFTVSQVYFMFVVEKFKLDVQETPTM